MSSQRLWLRAFQRSGPLGRPTPLRSAPQRRFDSNKAEHAEEAMKAKLEAAPRKTVPVPASGHPELVGAADNSFNRERAAIRAHAVQSSALWRKLMYYVAGPCIVLAAVNAWVLWKEHWEHWDHSPPPSERPQYSYMNIRTRKYPWGDGNKTLFWNDKVNYLPDDKVQ